MIPTLHGEIWSWIEGTVAPLDDALIAPIGGEACVAYEIWGYRALSGRQLEARVADFVLERGVERFVVQSAGMALERDELTARRFWTTGRARSAPALTYLEAHGLAGGPSRVMQVMEWTLPVGARVRLWGRARLLADADGDDAGYRAPPRRPVVQARRLEVIRPAPLSGSRG